MIKDIINNISKKKVEELDSYYIFVGEDKYNINKIIGCLKNKLAGIGADSFDFWNADTKDQSFSEVLNNVYAKPFISSRKVVCYTTIEKFEDDEIEKVNQYIKSSNNSSCLCLFVKNKTIIKKIKAKKENIIDLKVSNKIDGIWIRDFFKKNNKKINPASAESLKIFFSQNSMFAVENELEKILLYVGDKDVVTEEDVRQNIREVNVYNIFNLIDDMSSGKTKDAIKKLNDILNSGVSGQEILAMFFWNFKRLWNACVMQDAGAGLSDILAKVNVKAWAKAKFLSQVKRYNQKSLKSVFEKLAVLEKNLKINSVSDNILIEAFILGI